MSPVRALWILAVSFLVFSLISCGKLDGTNREPEDVTKFFKNGSKCGSSPDYAIYQQSSFEPSRWDHVITVHGFVDDARVANEIVALLEQSGKQAYKAVQINQ